MLPALATDHRSPAVEEEYGAVMAGELLKQQRFGRYSVVWGRGWGRGLISADLTTAAWRPYNTAGPPAVTRGPLTELPEIGTCLAKFCNAGVRNIP